MSLLLSRCARRSAISESCLVSWSQHAGGGNRNFLASTSPPKNMFQSSLSKRLAAAQRQRQHRSYCNFSSTNNRGSVLRDNKSSFLSGACRPCVPTKNGSYCSSSSSSCRRGASTSATAAAALMWGGASTLMKRARCEDGATAVLCEQHAMVSYPSRSTRRDVDDVDEPGALCWKRLSRNVRRAWRMLMRLIKLSFTLAPVTFFYPILLLSSEAGDRPADAHEVALAQKEFDDEDVGGLLGWYLRMCLTCVEWSGAAVIKLMQWAGSRPDLFGHDFCAVFSQLQDDTTPHSWSHTEKVMSEAYGKNWRDRITLDEIVGSGCIGQVYVGECVTDDTTGEKRKVAVKVLHPSVEEDIDADLDLMRCAVRAARYLPFDVFANLKWLNLEGVVEEFARLLKIQLDLRQEAENLRRFNQNFKDDEQVEFPELVHGYQPTKNVLVESYCDGVPVLQWAREHSEDKPRLQKMCKTAINAVCKMIFLDNFMHGDLHPGNVFVSPNGEKFILFDVGIVAEYSEADHMAIVDILGAFIRRKGREAGRLMIDDSNNRLSASQSGDHALDEELYIDKIEKLTIAASGSDYLMENLGSYISYICNAAAQHHILMNPSFVSAALAVKVQEGIALALDPAIQIWKVATPIIIESERRRHVTNVKRRFLGTSSSSASNSSGAEVVT